MFHDGVDAIERNAGCGCLMNVTLCKVQYLSTSLCFQWMHNGGQAHFFLSDDHRDGKAIFVTKQHLPEAFLQLTMLPRLIFKHSLHKHILKHVIHNVGVGNLCSQATSNLHCYCSVQSPQKNKYIWNARNMRQIVHQRAPERIKLMSLLETEVRDKWISESLTKKEVRKGA